METDPDQRGLENERLRFDFIFDISRQIGKYPFSEEQILYLLFECFAYLPAISIHCKYSVPIRIAHCPWYAVYCSLFQSFANIHFW